MKWKAVSMAGLVMALSHCAPNSEPSVKKPHERPWVGGEVVLVKRRSPESTGACAPLLVRVPNKTPLANGGLKEGDLIVEINGQSVESWEQVRQGLNAATQSPVDFKILRNGKFLHRQITPGVETYRNVITMGIKLSASPKKVDLRLIGFSRSDAELQLDHPEFVYLSNPQGSSEGFESDEGWKFWVGPIVLERNKTILSQQLKSVR